MKTDLKVISVTARCEEGHSQTLSVSASLGLEWAMQWAGLIDGTSALYVHSPIGSDSLIGKCGICGSQIKCTVEDSVDRSARVLTTGEPVTPDHREINPATGQQRDYVVLNDEERSKGFVRPVRLAYIHSGIEATWHGDSHVLVRAGKREDGRPACGRRTKMALSIAETYARDPKFYDGTFCVTCGVHLPLTEFVWEGTREQVGS